MDTPGEHEIVVTGLGLVTPIGIGKEAFWTSLAEGRSGVRALELFNGSDVPPAIAAEVLDFEPKKYVRPRKSLKVMSRSIELAFAAADMACCDAGICQQSVDPERIGVCFGTEMMPSDFPDIIETYRRCIDNGEFRYDRWGETAMENLYPLWMLKYLPNMPACHVAIAQDARGPNNSITLGEVSFLLAVAEATRVLKRGQADVMIVGGIGRRIHDAHWVRRPMYFASYRNGDPAAACRPFDVHRHGAVLGEGSAAFILETRRRAEARGAKILGSVLGYASTCEPCRRMDDLKGRAIRTAIRTALSQAGLTPDEIGHVNAHGMSTPLDDRIEAQAIHEMLGDVPVTAPKSYFGTHGAGTGAAEMAVSLLAFEHGRVPPTLNYETPDPECPVNVIHSEARDVDKPTALLLNHTHHGQAAAVLLGGPN